MATDGVTDVTDVTDGLFFDGALSQIRVSYPRYKQNREGGFCLFSSDFQSSDLKEVIKGDLY